MGGETDEVVSTCTASLARLSKLCNSLRENLNKSVELKATSTSAHARTVLSDGSLSLLELREVNRTVWDQIATLKGRSAAANQEVDAADLKLQNLQYEKNYFLREIRQSRDYPPDKPVELLAEADFRAAAAAAKPPLHVPSKPSDDPHAYHLARLQLELQQRQQLCEARDALLAERRRLEETIASRKAFLEGMSAQLHSITRISMPLQDLLKIDITRRWHESQQFTRLPPVLKVLFERAAAHRDTALPQLRVSVVGELEAANAAKRRKLLGGGGGGGGSGSGAGSGSAEGGGGGTDAADVEMADAVEVDDEEDDEAALLHPLKLLLVVPLPPPLTAVLDASGGEGAVTRLPEGDDDDDAGEVDGGAKDTRSLRLEFAYAPSLGVLTVRVDHAGGAADGGGASVNAAPESGGSAVGSTAVAAGHSLGAALSTKLFANLLGADTGKQLPTPPAVGHGKRGGRSSADSLPGDAPLSALSDTQKKEALLSLLPAVPYAWAQLLASVEPSVHTDVPELLDDPVFIFERVLRRLTQRVQAADALALQLDRLASLDASLPRSLCQPLPSPPLPPVSALAAWREIGDAAEELPPEARARMPRVAEWRAHGQRLFLATIQRAAPNAAPAEPPVQLGLTISLFSDFPASPPLVRLHWVTPPRRFAQGPRGPPPALRALAHPAALRLSALHRPACADLSLLQMEEELNRPGEQASELQQGGGVFALALGVQRAQTLLDVYLETEGDGGGATAIRGTLCSRRVRGRDRRRPFVYDPKSGQFDQPAAAAGSSRQDGKAARA